MAMANEDPAYLRWIRSLPCAMCGARPCEAHHKTGAGMALRSHDHDAMPLCTMCHGDLHALRGEFRDFDRATLRSWQETAARACRRAWGGLDQLTRAEHETLEEVF